MRRLLLSFIIFLTLFSGCDRKREPVTAACLESNKIETDEHSSTNALQKKLTRLQRQYDECGTVACCESYVEKIIDEGSNVLGLPAGAMDKGYATPADARKIAAYVMTLSGKRPTYPEWIQEGNLYYNGNCGGCHGDDGKGLGGAYPDLTLPLLKGATLYKESLANRIRMLETRLD